MGNPAASPWRPWAHNRSGRIWWPLTWSATTSIGGCWSVPKRAINCSTRLLTVSSMRKPAFARSITSPRPNFAVAEDSAQIMSAELFRQFCVPYDNKLFDAFGSGVRDGRGMHMCGKSDHLHSALIEEEQITSFQLFGHNVAPRVAARISEASATCGGTSTRSCCSKVLRRKSAKRRRNSWRLWVPPEAWCWATGPTFAPGRHCITLRWYETPRRNTRGKDLNCLPWRRGKR